MYASLPQRGETMVKCSVDLRIMESIESGNSKLRRVETDNIRHLKLALPMEAFQCLTRMRIDSDLEVTKLSELEEVFFRCSSSLRKLEIRCCPKLKSVSGGLVHLTALERLQLFHLPNRSLGKAGEGEEDEDEEGEEDDGMHFSCFVDSVYHTTSEKWSKRVKLPNGVHDFQRLKSLLIKSDSEVEKLPEVEELLRSCSSSVQHLEIGGCDGLKSVHGGLEHPTALELVLYDSSNVSLSKVGEGEGQEDDEDGMPWRCLHSLQSLELRRLENLVNLPNGLRYLSALQSLEIWNCTNLKSLPDWIPELTSLKKLTLG